MSVVRLDELDGDANTVTGATNAAGDDGLNMQLCADLARIDLLAFISENGSARWDTKRVHPCQRTNQLLRHAVAEVLVGRVTAEALKWEYCHRGSRWRRPHDATSSSTHLPD